jgi:iron(III) transport system substrate-binding protein
MIPMRLSNIAALLLLGLLAVPAQAAAPAPTIIDQKLIDAARKEGTVVWYTSTDVEIAEALGKAFEAKYPGMKVQIDRSGSERVFQRIGQEHMANVAACDVVNSSDAAHFIYWKREGWLAPYVPEDVAKYFPADQQDADGLFATVRATLSTIGYNSKLVTADEAPKGFLDLLDPKWAGKIVKSHPSYSGGTLTATFEIARDVGWDYFEKLSKQRVMQVESATDPAKKVVLGERAIMADGSEYSLLLAHDRGGSIEPIYPVEGTPLIASPAAILKDAPHPNAARLFDSFLFSVEGQQLLVDIGAMRSWHSQVKERPGRVPMSAIKLMKEDPVGVEQNIEAIKKRYTGYFKT